MLFRITFVSLGILLLFSSCQDKGCCTTNNNAILASNIYSSKAYQAELYRLIKESPEVDYYFEMREEILGQTYLVVNAYGDAFCGKLCLIISEEEAKKILVDKRYQGAQLIGLRYKKQKADYGWSTLVYDSMEYMVN